MNWVAEQPYNALPPLPPTMELETRAVLKACIPARAARASMRQPAALMPNPAMLGNEAHDYKQYALRRPATARTCMHQGEENNEQFRVPAG